MEPNLPVGLTAAAAAEAVCCGGSVVHLEAVGGAFPVERGGRGDRSDAQVSFPPFTVPFFILGMPQHGSHTGLGDFAWVC